MIVLSAYVKDNFNSSSQEADAQVKYVAVNGETVWTDGISENEDWQHHCSSHFSARGQQ